MREIRPGNSSGSYCETVENFISKEWSQKGMEELIVMLKEAWNIPRTLEKAPCEYARPSSLIGNLTSQEPTIF